MSTLLPQYQYDVFVSYARVDDEPMLPGDENSRWVRTLKQSLQTLLHQRAKGASIWMDVADIAGNRKFSGEIRDGIARSATLLVIMSDGYLESEWCLRELESFVDAAGPSAIEGRIFVVHRDEIPFDRWPDQLRELNGYPFYVKDEQTGDAMPLAVPKPDPAEKEYFARLHRLRDQLARQLKSIQDGGSDPAALQGPPEATAPAPPEAGQSATVFLAEVTGDLYEDREQLRSHLEQAGMEVLPTRFYCRTPAGFQRALDRDLARSAMFVQLLGPYPSPRAEDLPQGYDGLQFARAEAAGVPILQWRRPSLDGASVRDEQHRNLLFADGVLATDLEEFKRIVAESVRKTLAQADRAAGNGESFILLNAAGRDLALADTIADRLSERGLAFDIVGESTPLANLAEAEQYDGMIVIYGDSPQQWVQQQVRQCRRIVLEKKHRAPECAVLIGPPESKEPLRCRPPRFHLIDEQDQSQLEEYLAALRQRGPGE